MQNVAAKMEKASGQMMTKMTKIMMMMKFCFGGVDVKNKSHSCYLVLGALP